MSLLYSDRGNLSLGFHGCKKSVAIALISTPDVVKFSKNDWDWLGSGFYIWENNYERAKEWADAQYGNEGAVVGVVYELGTCLDLMDSGCIQLLKYARTEFEKDMTTAGKQLPGNKDLRNDPDKDKKLRRLDCAVINYLTARTDKACREEQKANGFNITRPFDSVRGCFNEGAKIPGMEIYEKTHIQIAIRNLNCIKGFFLPRTEITFP